MKKICQKLHLAHLVRVRRARGSRVEPRQQPLGVNSLSAVARRRIPGSPATDHKILTRNKGIGHKLMVTEMQLGTATEALLEVDPFAIVASDLDLSVLDWQIQCSMWYVIMYMCLYTVSSYRILCYSSNCSC